MKMVPKGWEYIAIGVIFGAVVTFLLVLPWVPNTDWQVVSGGPVRAGADISDHDTVLFFGLFLIMPVISALLLVSAWTHRKAKLYPILTAVPAAIILILYILSFVGGIITQIK